MKKKQIKFYTSNFLNKLVLLVVILIFLTGVLFILSGKVQLSVAAVWISAGLLWLLRYGWQIKNPYIDISDTEMIISKSPVLRKKINIADMEKIIKKTNFKIVLKVKNDRNVGISLFPVEKTKRSALISIVNKIVYNNKNK